MIATAIPRPIDEEFSVEWVSPISETVIDAGLPGARSQRLVVRVSLSRDSRTTSADRDEDQKIDVFLETVYVLCECGETRKALDAVFQTFNKLLNRSGFRLCDKILSKVDLSRLDSTLLVGFLSITLAAKEFLTYRANFFAKAFASLVRERGRDRTARLLKKYE